MLAIAPADGLWHRTIGRHELGERNCAGKELKKLEPIARLPGR